MTAGPYDPPPHVLPAVDLELLRAGLARCRWCGGTRPVDCWCTCRPVDDQLAEIQAEARVELEAIAAAKAPSSAELLHRIDAAADQLAALRADVVARLELDALEHTLAGRLERLRFAVADLAATVVVQAGVMAPAHVVSAAAHWLDWWRGRAGAGPYRRDAAVWWLRGGPLGERGRR